MKNWQVAHTKVGVNLTTLSWVSQLCPAFVNVTTDQLLQAYKHCYLHSASAAFSLSPANYVINEEYKFIYFEIPKVASTAIRTLIHEVCCFNQDEKIIRP